jgi:hypothetical protein
MKPIRTRNRVELTTRTLQRSKVSPKRGTVEIKDGQRVWVRWDDSPRIQLSGSYWVGDDRAEVCRLGEAS